MHNFALAAEVLWKVLLVGLLLGAGLPALFAVGVRGLAMASPGGTSDAPGARANPAGRVLAIACFALVVAFVITGLFVIVAAGYGKAVSFEHIYPTIVPKS